jgi:hypothetical protein
MWELCAGLCDALESALFHPHILVLDTLHKPPNYPQSILAGPECIVSLLLLVSTASAEAVTRRLIFFTIQVLSIVTRKNRKLHLYNILENEIGRA